MYVDLIEKDFYTTRVYNTLLVFGSQLEVYILVVKRYTNQRRNYNGKMESTPYGVR